MMFFCFYMSFRAAEQLLFCSVFRPFSKAGKFGLHTGSKFFGYFNFKVERDILPKGLAFRINYLGLGPGRYR